MSVKLDTVGVCGSNPHAPTIHFNKLRRTTTFSVASKSSSEHGGSFGQDVGPLSGLLNVIERIFDQAVCRFHVSLNQR